MRASRNARYVAVAMTLACATLASCTPAPSGGSGGEGPAPTAVMIPSAAPAPSGDVPWVTSMPLMAVPAYDAGAPRSNDAGSTGTIVKNGGDDPLAGRFSLADATRDLKGLGTLIARIETTRGPLECKLYDDKAPHTVANFVGLARGVRPWKNAQGQWIRKAAYDGTSFHRIIKGFMIQGGDPIGDGVGDLGYVIDDEIWPGATHDRAGLLCMANRGKNTNAAQFFITDGPALHLDSKGYTIFGECSPIARIHELAAWQVAGDKALSPPIITAVTIVRRASP